ncbi:cell division protein PerM [Streptomyces sp. 8N706]|uniref:cell division protein PerM n=1 Tax=Streptomyces sp. 8N706 TaxID=3457416 RepID=UPI003FD21D4A
MTQLTDHSTPLSSRVQTDAWRAPVAGAAMLGGVVAAALGLGAMTVAVLLLWIAAPYPDSGPGGALHVAAALWLLAHGAELVRTETLTGVPAPLGLVPLLLCALPAWLLYRTARYAVESREEGLARYGRQGGDPPLVGPTIGWLSAGYLSVGLAAVTYTAGGPLRPGLLSALLHLPVVATGVLAYGVWTANGRPAVPLPLQQALDRVPRGVWAVLTRPRLDTALRSAAASTTVLLGGGALLVMVSLVRHGFAGQQSWLELPEAWSGRCAFLLLSLALVPNAVVWGAAYGLGPGFTLGAGSSAGLLGASAYPSLPAFPLFAALPEQGPGSPLTWAAGVVPVLAGVGSGWFTARAAVPRPGAAAARLPGTARGAEAAGAAEPRSGGGGARAAGPTSGGGATRATGPTTGAAAGEAQPSEDSRKVQEESRKVREVRSLRETALTSALASVGCTVAMVLLAGLSGGSLGSNGLSDFGPSWWLTGGATLCWTLLVGTPTALLLRWWWLREQQRADERESAPAVLAVPPAQRDRHGDRSGGWMGGRLRGARAVPRPAADGDGSPRKERGRGPFLPRSRKSPAEEGNPADGRYGVRGSWLPLPRTGPTADGPQLPGGGAGPLQAWRFVPRRRLGADDLPSRPHLPPQAQTSASPVRAATDTGGGGGTGEGGTAGRRRRPRVPRVRSLWARLCSARKAGAASEGNGDEIPGVVPLPEDASRGAVPDAVPPADGDDPPLPDA